MPAQLASVRRRLTILALSLTLLLSVLVTAQVAGAQTAAHEERSGTLPDGTEYLLRVPTDWNGTLINDLDYSSSADEEFYTYLLEQGYATSGTARHPQRRTEYDPRQEVRNQIRVLDLFAAEFDTPERTLQYGHSGGGLVALGVAETFPERIDGAISGCFQVPIPNHNMRVDGLFALKALIAPDSDLAIVDIPDDPSALIADWEEAITAAQQTPEGRARIALAIAIAQLPTWSDTSAPAPDPDDLAAVQKAMFTTMMNTAAASLRTRFMIESAAGGVSSWTVGIDYADAYNAANPTQRATVEALYDQAGLELADDLGAINAAPRIEPDPGAIAFWRVPPRTLNGDPDVPVLHFGTVGDTSAPPTQMQGYQARVEAQGRADLYRQAFVDRAGHCTFSVSERVAMVQTMMERLDSGDWGDTSPEALNALAASFDLDDALFIPLELDEFTRAFYPETPVPGLSTARMERIAGATRFETAVEVSRLGFPEGAEVVYLARADDFADALVAGVLDDGPILLVPRCEEVPAVVLDEIVRLSPSVVRPLGGSAAICDQVIDAVMGALGSTPA